jgi:hypothetical protein
MQQGNNLKLVHIYKLIDSLNYFPLLSASTFLHFSIQCTLIFSSPLCFISHCVQISPWVKRPGNEANLSFPYITNVMGATVPALSLCAWTDVYFVYEFSFLLVSNANFSPFELYSSTSILLHFFT